MKGLELAEAYYDAYGKDMVRNRFPGYADRIAAGLAGPGSECFGFDDALSADHDYGPGFCLWLTREDAEEIGAALQQAYDELPKDFLGVPARKTTPRGGGRVGVIVIDDFYRNLVGSPDGEMNALHWLRVPESSFAAATNGKVFADPLGRFTGVREILLGYYPENVRLKKIAARAALAGQAGQYNFPRCMRRGELVAAAIALGEFMRSALSLAFLLNRAYAPFYKWTRRALDRLPQLTEIGRHLDRIADAGLDRAAWLDEEWRRPNARINRADVNVDAVETVCELLVAELRAQGLSDRAGDFLADHAEDVFARVADDGLRRLHIMEG